MDSLTSMFLLTWLIPAVLFVPATVIAFFSFGKSESFFLVRMHPMTFLPTSLSAPTALALWLAVAVTPLLNLGLAPVFVGMFFLNLSSRNRAQAT